MNDLTPLAHSYDPNNPTNNPANNPYSALSPLNNALKSNNNFSAMHNPMLRPQGSNPNNPNNNPYNHHLTSASSLQMYNNPHMYHNNPNNPYGQSVSLPMHMNSLNSNPNNPHAHHHLLRNPYNPHLAPNPYQNHPNGMYNPNQLAMLTHPSLSPQLNTSSASVSQQTNMYIKDTLHTSLPTVTVGTLKPSGNTQKTII